MTDEPAQEPPFHLRGNFAPVAEEVTVAQPEVEGAIPPELCGVYLRTGPNPRSGRSPHWFLGDGMVHGLRLDSGRASWYRNRWVRTRRFERPELERVSPEGEFDRTLSTANTHVLAHAGRIWALEEGSFPYLLDRELRTLGFCDFGGRLRTAFTAHPRICPTTGEMLAFGYGQLPPFLTYHRISPEGLLLQSQEIPVPGPTMVHDFAITERYALFLDLPIVFDASLLGSGGMPFRWSDDYGARIGVMPRSGSARDLRWFEIEPCYVFHTVNAWEEQGQIAIDACRYQSLWREPGDFRRGGAQDLHRFRLDLASGRAREEVLDDIACEFPRVADARVGRRHGFAYMALAEVTGRDAPLVRGLLKWDAARGAMQVLDPGPGRFPGEPVFVPAAGSRSDEEGFLLTLLFDAAAARSELWILDAARFPSKPLARVLLPRRIPFGFHGSWIADQAG